MYESMSSFPATEEYLLLLTDRTIYDECNAKKIMHEVKNIDMELLRTSTPKVG